MAITNSEKKFDNYGDAFQRHILQCIQTNVLKY